MTRLSPLDTAVSVVYMLILFGVGLWFARRQKELKTYLLADQNVHWVIVGISILAALFSGISYLGAPAEAFFYDLSYLWAVASFLIATPITTLVFLPFFRGLKLYTAYEYLEKRFHPRMRHLASTLFLIRVSFYVGLAIYAPALAVTEVTGWPFWFSVLFTGIAATLYTTLGGMQAVIWTDTLQFLVLCGGIIVILGFAIAAVPGGLPVIWQLAAADGKTGLWHTQLDPTVRITIWSGLLGGMSHNLVMMVTDQISVQRYLTAPSLKRQPARSVAQAMGNVSFGRPVLFERHRALRILQGVSRASALVRPGPVWFQAWPHLHLAQAGREFPTTVCCLILSSIIFRARCRDFSLPAFVERRWPWSQQPSTRWRRQPCWISGVARYLMCPIVCRSAGHAF